MFFWVRRRCCRRSLSLFSVYAPTFFFSLQPYHLILSLSLMRPLTLSLSLSQKKKRRSESTSIVLSPRWMIFYTRQPYYLQPCIIFFSVSLIHHPLSLSLSLTDPSSLSLPLSHRSILTLSLTLSLFPQKSQRQRSNSKKNENRILYDENRIPYTESYTVAVNRIEDDAPCSQLPATFKPKKKNKLNKFLF